MKQIFKNLYLVKVGPVPMLAFRVNSVKLAIALNILLVVTVASIIATVIVK